MEDFYYKRLIVWQKAMELVKEVYALCKMLPPDERYALTDQIRRAVVSIPSNIAEGCGRATDRDYGHFIAIARGSLYETATQLEIAESLGYIEISEDFHNRTLELGRMLGAMLKKYANIQCSTSSFN